MNRLAKRLKAAREKLEETQAVFASRFGVDQSTLHRWETNGPSDRGAAKTLVQKTLAELENAAVRQ